ncbi:alpha/beta hydrolase [Rhodophyticola porphyridii]|uniref:alpha/beta hydrolase n=1 Tax=Rhodophyticola porphyridii TaxID=1852017 RepID=UPI0035CFE72C
MPLHPDARALIGEPRPQPRDWDVAEVRAAEFKSIPLGGQPVAVASVEDLDIPGHPELSITHYAPMDRDQGPGIIWFPGGGFVCPPTAYDRSMRRLCRESKRDVFLAHYRLAPEHPFPAQYEDAPVLFQHALQYATRKSPTEALLHVGGDSSGGNIAATLALHADREAKKHIASVSLIYPMLDATCSQPSYQTYAEGYGFTARKSEWYFRQWIAQSEVRDPRASPYWVEDLSNFGRCFVASAECDPLRDEAEAFAGRLIAAGNDCRVKRYEGMIHGFFQMPGVLQGGEALIVDLARYLERGAVA